MNEHTEKEKKLEAEIIRLKSEVRTLQKSREREKYTLRQKQKNAERLDIQIRELRERVEKLNVLEDAGVDNWEGYDYAMRNLRCSLE